MKNISAGSSIIGITLMSAASLYLHTLVSEHSNNKIKSKIVNTTNISANDLNKIAKGVNKGTITWQQALDSLKTEAAVKKAYFQGGQAVRDSLANVAKTAKMVKL